MLARLAKAAIDPGKISGQFGAESANSLVAMRSQHRRRRRAFPPLWPSLLRWGAIVEMPPNNHRG
jgi:hypothetical protein